MCRYNESADGDQGEPPHVQALRRPNVARKLRRRIIDELADQWLFCAGDVARILREKFCVGDDPGVLRNLIELAVEPLERRGLIYRGDTSSMDLDDEVSDWTPPAPMSPFESWLEHTLWLPRQDKLDMLERRTESLYEFADE